MADLITTILTTAIEHAPGTTVVVAAYKAAQPFLAKILGPGAEEIGEIGRDYIKGRRAKNAERTLADADKLLTEAGREPQEVPLDVVLPLLEAASLQENPTLAEKWAALLANAADPAQRVAVTVALTDALRQLTPLDAIILQQVAAFSDTASLESRPLIFCDSKQIQQEVIGSDATLTRAFRVGVDNLLRLKLCDGRGTRNPDKQDFVPGMITGHALTIAQGPGKDRLAVTDLGLAFLTAVTPPTP